ncbi:streptolysin associated protein SagC [Brachyspira suanatina]|uniref:Streptolysin associated protein SagC n=1 Tax=Brachyspira suanatina TaxID=381802 RepID=A0A0G4K499_9SPIR|nr:streptolysin associated protein SagC [Brachyspira suanatina]CRF31834.1 streptolysin associated protein SagC [Brachyspira suanatina]
MDNKNIKLYDNVTIFFNSNDEIRFRKGIWNFEEATLGLNDLNDNIKEALIFFAKELFDDKLISFENIVKKFSLNEKDSNFLDEIISSLIGNRFLEYDDKKNNMLNTVYEFIGEYFYDIPDESKVQKNKVMFITDNARLKEYAKLTSEDLYMNVAMMDSDDIKNLEKANLTDTSDAIENIEAYKELIKLFDGISCVVVSVEKPRLNLLRNINRLLLDKSIPIVISILDGPFLNITTIKGKETGCYECFENRVVARNESLSVYNKFVKQTMDFKLNSKKTYITPILQTFTSLALYEAFLFATIGRCKLAGRVINVYMPLIEIQIQDLLRVPFCPACGHISKAKYDEMYTSSRKIIENLSSKVIING